VGRGLSSSATLSVPHNHPEEVLEGVRAAMGMVSSHKVALEGGANVIAIGARGVMKVTPFIPLILRGNGQTLTFWEGAYVKTKLLLAGSLALAV
jgi:hypothetical protein